MHRIAAVACLAVLAAPAAATAARPVVAVTRVVSCAHGRCVETGGMSSTSFTLGTTRGSAVRVERVVRR